ncbi:hypothetical protein DRH27_01765 [Candidatus Falkowbacteria bacterium]|nr:MAG: hypothetical protein DRH27_01765 [Candidatus Falkowbacteria bacterium]
MRKEKSLWLKVFLIWISFFSFFFLFSLNAVAGEKLKHIIGLGIFYGQKAPSSMPGPDYKDRDWDYIKIHPSYGWVLSDRWLAEIEGSLGMCRFKDRNGEKENIYSLGASLVVSYDFYKQKHFSLYLDAGAGAGYWTGTPDRGLVDNNAVIGLLKFGAGVKVPFGENWKAKVAFRSNHSSGIFVPDAGCNTQDVFLGIIKYF